MNSSGLTWKSLLRRLDAAAFTMLLAACASAQVARPELAEIAAGDLVADALKAATGAHAALVQASSLQPVDLSPGPAPNVAPESLLTYPDETISVVEMKGDRLIAALERGLSVLPRPQKGFLQVAGITVFYNPKAPPGQRVVRVLLGQQPLSPSQSLRVAMPQSLSRGHLGFFRVFNGLPRQDTGQTMKDAVARYLAAKPVLPEPGERLRPAG